jgi:hypothetical protein
MWERNGELIELIYGIENFISSKPKDNETKPLVKLRKDIYDIFLGNEKRKIIFEASLK